ncbi:RHS repeat domain-containing protein, partial [Thermoproteota archaeon]
PVVIYLKYGWNFVSFPVEPPDFSVESVLAPIAGDYDQVCFFNAQTDKFEHYTGDTEFDDFSNFEYGKGYQIFCTNPAGTDFIVVGQTPEQISVQLKQGYNLITNPNIETLPVEIALAGLVKDTDYDQVYRYDTLTGVYDSFPSGSLQYLEPGQGYFLHCLHDISWSMPWNGTTSFTYGGDGGRVTKSVGSVTNTYIGSLYEERNDTGQIDTFTKHVFLGATRITSLTTDSQQQTDTHYYHSNHLGSSNIITDETGAQVALYEYAPYGTLASMSSGEEKTNYKFTGKEMDSSTGLYFYGGRYYDPEIARFITPDTIVPSASDPQTLNRYAYCRNNPLKYVDPSGHFFWFIILGFFIGALGAGFQSGWDPKAMLIGAGIGAVSGAAGFGMSSFASNALGAIGSSVAGGAAGGMVGGVLNSAYYGDDLIRGALLGAGYGAVGGLAFGSIAQLGGKGWGWDLARVGLSGVAGGGVAEMSGGEFWQGAAFAGAIAGADFLYRTVSGKAPSVNKATDEGEYRKKGVSAQNEGANRVGATMEPGKRGSRGNISEFLFGETGSIPEGVGRHLDFAQSTALFHDPLADVIGKNFSFGGRIGEAVGFASLTVPTIPPSYCLTVLGAAMSKQPYLIGLYGVYGEDFD